MSIAGDIYVNGDSYQVSPKTTVAQLLSDLGFSERQVVVELNTLILQKEDWQETQLKTGDRVEVIGFVGGGSHLGDSMEFGA